MIKKILSTLILASFATSTFAFWGFGSKRSNGEETDVKELSWQSLDRFDSYLKDEGNRVSNLFEIPPFYYPNVKFWFLIYTHFGSNQVVVHDMNNLDIIYKVLDFTSLHKKNLSTNTIYVLQQKISADKLDQVKRDLDFLIKNPFSLDSRVKGIYETFKVAGITPPVSKNSRINFFKKLRDNIRTQTGQKNFIRDGIVRSLPYQSFLNSYFEAKNLPRELLAIPFLESSFNPKAHSKVNALGIWQFMPHIGKHFVPKTTDQFDYRSNVGVASVSAAYLMSENYKILKSWDLAVTAYNSGTRHLLKSKRLLKKSQVTLEEIIKISDTEHFGFASKNFYSEFLALVYTLAYKEDLYRDIHSHERSDIGQDLLFYLTKCPLKIDRHLSERELDDVLFHNHQISNISKSFPKGSIVTTKRQLPKSHFYPVAIKDMTKKKPKEWSNFLKNQSCSTR